MQSLQRMSAVEKYKSSSKEFQPIKATQENLYKYNNCYMSCLSFFPHLSDSDKGGNNVYM